MRLFIFLILIGFISFSAKAEDKNKTTATYRISGDAQVLSQFVDKGLAYSDRNPAMNASFLFNLGSQVKLGFWGTNISNVSAADDNFWFRFLGDIVIEWNQKLSSRIFLYDNHFYKSSQRNGLVVGADFNYNTYEFGFEWQSNFEGTKQAAEYIKFGKLFDYKKGFKYGGYAGLTYSHDTTLQGYLDFKVVGQYIINSYSNVEVGATFISNAAQFGSRGDPAFYVGIKLSY